MTGFQKVYANTDLVSTIDGTKDLADIINIYDTIFCFASFPPLTINLSIPYQSYSNLSKSEHGYWVSAPTLLILRQGGIQNQVRFHVHEKDVSGSIEISVNLEVTIWTMKDLCSS